MASGCIYGNAPFPGHERRRAMLRKILHALGLAIAHAAVLFAAHGVATHVGQEVAGLVRDEWLIDGGERLIAVVFER